MGSGQLALKIGLPLGQPEDVKVAGEFAFSEAELRIAGAPSLTKLGGKLSFTGHDVSARDVAAEILGGPAKLAVTNIGGQTRMSGTGTFGLASVRREYASPYLDRVSGSLDWSMKVDIVSPGTLGWVFESNMKGTAVDLPAPIGKSAGEEMPLRVEGRDDASPPGTDFILATYGRVAQFAAHRTPGNGGASIDRALLSLGRAIEQPDAARADRPGLWVRGELPALNVDDWIAMVPKLEVTESLRQNPGLVLAGADFDVHQFDAMGARFTDLKLRMRESARGWTFDIDGPEVAGTANWSAPGAGAPNGRIVARLARISLPGRGSVASWRDTKEAGVDAQSDAPAANPWPEIDLAADAMYLEGPESWPARVRRAAKGSRLEGRPLLLANDVGAARSQRRMAGRRAAAANEARRRPRREGSRRVPGAIRLCRGRQGGAGADRRATRVVRRAP